MLIECESVSYKYDKHFGINDISLSFESGNFYTVMGQNGSGKSTLLRVLSGNIKPQSGSVFVNGKELFSFSEKSRAGLISYLPQNISCDFPYTCREAVSFGRVAFSKFFASANDEKIIYEVMELTNTLQFADRKITEISGGEYRRVMIAQVLAQQAECIILDEPVSSLDISSSFEIIRLLFDLAVKKGLLVIVCLHEVNTAFCFPQEFIFMKNGSVLAKGHSEEILSETLIKDVYGIEAEIVNYGGVGDEKIPIIRKIR